MVGALWPAAGYRLNDTMIHTKTLYKPRVVIAGLRGGSGKTTLSLGLLRLWKNKGRHIVPFKKGPDYIDAAWLSGAAGAHCYNLDSYIIAEHQLINSLAGHSEASDGILIEGNRGLFDGVDARGTFSTAALAQMCASPVILVVDCVKAAATVGVIVKGIIEFSKELMIKGVVLNYISNDRHEKVIREAVETHAGVPVVGVLRRDDTPFQQERHMGLTSRDETAAMADGIEAILERMAAACGSTVDEENIWQIAMSAPPLEYSAPDTSYGLSEYTADVKIGVVRDSAFQFYYPENIEALERHGAEIVELSALAADDMPEGLDAVYIGGGFPETHALRLSENKSFMGKLKELIECGLPVYAECGGLMYLGRGIVYNEQYYPMAGIFPIDFVMYEKPQAHGYTIVETVEETPYFPKNVILRGHEFHYSKAVNLEMEGLSFRFKMKRGKGIVDGRDGLLYKQVFATYTHIHALGYALWAEWLVRAAAAYKNGR
ncbi:MAG: cobyrinate a,c-diamide synthase [Nitrospirae bacterium]|nr:cobyrinate a,c-diamide synthase [Nitrospirota bacterium]